MVSAITPGSPPSTSGAPPSRADIEIQITRYKAQMADWVTCPSASTPQGKTMIAQISTRLTAAESRLAGLASAPVQGVQAPASAAQPTASCCGSVDVYA